MTDAASHPVDVHVGARVRARRKALGLGQSALADALGLTFQQVQKYERGHNRISASKLWDTARALSVSIDYFFEGLDGSDLPVDEQPSELSISSFLKTAEGVELAQAFPAIKLPRHRRRVLELVKALAVDEDG